MAGEAQRPGDPPSPATPTPVLLLHHLGSSGRHLPPAGETAWGAGSSAGKSFTSAQQPLFLCSTQCWALGTGGARDANDSNPFPLPGLSSPLCLAGRDFLHRETVRTATTRDKTQARRGPRPGDGLIVGAGGPGPTHCWQPLRRVGRAWPSDQAMCQSLSAVGLALPSSVLVAEAWAHH